MKRIARRRWIFVPAILFTLLAGCATTKPKGQTDAPADTPKSDAAIRADTPPGTFYIDPDRQIRWSYPDLPTPNPPGKPNYLLKSITFPKSSQQFDNEARGVLRELAADLKSRTQIHVLVVGHCDRGPERVNADNLALGRAQSVRQVLLDAGVAKERIEVASFGAVHAHADENEPIGQEQDRKVEVWLLKE